MTNEIQKQEWKQFFDDTSRRYLGWQTRVEVLKEDIGAQILSDGLSLIGFVFEEKNGEGTGEKQSSIEIILGEESGAHQTHTVVNPRAVAFLRNDESPDGTIEIEDEEAAKTLVYLVQPISVEAAYIKLEESASVITTANFGE